METLIRKLNDARNKELILHYLRWVKPSREDTSLMLEKLFHQKISDQQIQEYAQNLIDDGLVNYAEQNHSPIIWYIVKSEGFIENGGYVKKLFVEEKLIFDEKKFIQAHHKDLILSLMIYAGIGNWEIVNLSTMLFPKYEDETMRNYSDEFSENGYVKQGASNASIQYEKEAIAFIEEGGYTGQYLSQLKHKAYQESEEVQKQSKRQKEIADKEERIKNLNIDTRHFFLFEKGRWIILAVIIVVVLLIIIGVIPLCKVLEALFSKI